jgi:hypothetical protein
MTVIKLGDTPFRRRYNFKKANWSTFTKDLDAAVIALESVNENYIAFIKLVKIISRKIIPIISRVKYKTGLTSELVVETLEQYIDRCKTNPFEENTIEKGEELIKLLTDSGVAEV